jgi:hypothetical protein
MSAATALRAALDANVHLRVVGDDLDLTAPLEPPFHVLALLSRNKPEIVRLLRSAIEAREDWHDFFNERAAIAEFDGQLTRHTAEVHAFARCLVEWLIRNRPNAADDLLGPYGIESAVQDWLRTRNWPAHQAGQIFGVTTAIEKMGIVEPRRSP